MTLLNKELFFLLGNSNIRIQLKNQNYLDIKLIQKII
jgi:hypothetical protein